MRREFLEPLCKKRAQMFFYEEIWRMGKKYENYDLTDTELSDIERKFNNFIKGYNPTEQEIMRSEFEALCKFYRRKRDEINAPYV